MNLHNPTPHDRDPSNDLTELFDTIGLSKVERVLLSDFFARHAAEMREECARVAMAVTASDGPTDMLYAIKALFRARIAAAIRESGRE